MSCVFLRAPRLSERYASYASGSWPACTGRGPCGTTRRRDPAPRPRRRRGLGRAPPWGRWASDRRRRAAGRRRPERCGGGRRMEVNLMGAQRGGFLSGKEALARVEHRGRRGGARSPAVEGRRLHRRRCLRIGSGAPASAGRASPARPTSFRRVPRGRWRITLGTLVTGGATALVAGGVLAAGAEVWTLGAGPTSGLPDTVACADTAALAGGAGGSLGGSVETTAHIASGASAMAAMPGTPTWAARGGRRGAPRGAPVGRGPSRAAPRPEPRPSARSRWAARTGRWRLQRHPWPRGSERSRAREHLRRPRSRRWQDRPRERPPPSRRARGRVRRRPRRGRVVDRLAEDSSP